MTSPVFRSINVVLGMLVLIILPRGYLSTAGAGIGWVGSIAIDLGLATETVLAMRGRVWVKSCVAGKLKGKAFLVKLAACAIKSRVFEPAKV